MEANDGYSRAEVDKCLAKEKETLELQQRLQYRIECLETELDNANRVREGKLEYFNIRNIIDLTLLHKFNIL